MLYLMDLTLTTNITSRDSLVGAPPDTNRFSILERNKEFLTGTSQAPYQFFLDEEILVRTPRTQLEIRKDRAISTRAHVFFSK